LNVGLEDLWKGALTGITNILNTLNEMPKVFGKLPIAAIGVVTNAITTIRSLINIAITDISRTVVNAARSTGTEASTAMEQGIRTGQVKITKAFSDVFTNFKLNKQLRWS